MSIVTLTTDFGTADHYVAQFKGVLLRSMADLQIVDITHQVPPYDISAGAFMLKCSFMYFPKGTIHIIRVNESGIKNNGLLVAAHKGHIFLGPDNGIISLITDDQLDWVYKLDDDDKNFIKLNQYYLKWIEDIVKNGRPERFVVPTTEWKQLTSFRPVIKETEIVGSIIMIDRFGNGITNIHFRDFQSFQSFNHYRIFYNRNEDVSFHKDEYDDVVPGNTLDRFNDNGYLVLAINQGNFAQLCGIKAGHNIKVTFTE
jgi:hypothetical protein